MRAMFLSKLRAAAVAAVAAVAVTVPAAGLFWRGADARAQQPEPPAPPVVQPAPRAAGGGKQPATPLISAGGGDRVDSLLAEVARLRQDLEDTRKRLAAVEAKHGTTAPAGSPAAPAGPRPTGADLERLKQSGYLPGRPLDPAAFEKLKRSGYLSYTEPDLDPAAFEKLKRSGNLSYTEPDLDAPGTPRGTPGTATTPGGSPSAKQTPRIPMAADPVERRLDDLLREVEALRRELRSAPPGTPGPGARPPSPRP